MIVATSPLALFFWLLVGHSLCDYPLQGDFLARAKNQHAPLPGIPWEIALAAHALIHAGAVAFLTGSILLGLAEFVAHTAIDWIKSELITDFAMDQMLHVACKVLWILVLVHIGHVVSLP